MTENWPFLFAEFINRLCRKGSYRSCPFSLENYDKEVQMDEQNNLEQVRRPDDGVKVNVSRDGKWLIIRAPGLEQPIIKAVAYFEKILERARSGRGYDVQTIKE